MNPSPHRTFPYTNTTVPVLTSRVPAARAFVALVLSVAIPGFAALALTGCGVDAPEATPDAAVVVDAGTDAPMVDPRTDVPPVTRRDSGPGVDVVALDAGTDTGPEGDVRRVDVGTDAGADGGAAPGDTGPEVDVLRVDAGTDAGPVGRACSTGADCPAFPGWTCLGAPGACRCTPSGGDDLCGRRDRDCDGVADPEVTCSNRCVNPTTDPRNCGGCGRACSTGEGCVGGACRCETPGTGRRTLCGGCVDVTDRGGTTTAFCTFCLTTCSAASRRRNPAHNDCCNAACGILSTPDPCR